MRYTVDNITRVDIGGRHRSISSIVPRMDPLSLASLTTSHTLVTNPTAKRSLTAVESIVEATRLPPEVWRVVPMYSKGFSYEVFHSGPDGDDVFDIGPSRIENPESIIGALGALSVSSMLGQGVLAQTGTDSTAMVSIAEAASVLLGEPLSNLVWILLEFIAQELRAESVGRSRLYTIIRWETEIEPPPDSIAEERVKWQAEGPARQDRLLKAKKRLKDLEKEKRVGDWVINQALGNLGYSGYTHRGGQSICRFRKESGMYYTLRR